MPDSHGELVATEPDDPGQIFYRRFGNFFSRMAMRAMSKFFGDDIQGGHNQDCALRKDFRDLLQEIISKSGKESYCPFIGTVTPGTAPKWKSRDERLLYWDERRLSERVIYALAFGQHTVPIRRGGEIEFYRSWHVGKGAGRWRRIDAPRKCLGAVQETILASLLGPGLSDAQPHVTCIKGRSAIDGASAHSGARFLVGMDVKDFYPSIRTSLVIEKLGSLPRPATWSQSLRQIAFRKTFPRLPLPLRGIPGPMLAMAKDWLNVQCVSVPIHLAPLASARRCDHEGCWFRAWLSLPENRFLSHWEAVLLGRLLTWRGSLPQGAPSSPAMANLAFGKFDKRIIEGLGPRFTYTRYMDDLSISITAKDAKVQMIGDASALRRFALGVVNGALRDSGFRLNLAKTTATEAGPAGSGKVHTVTGYRVGAGLIDLPRETKRFFRGLAGRIRKAGGRLDVLAKGQCAKGIRRIANVGWIGGKESRECDDGHENSKELESLALVNRLYPKLKWARGSNQLREIMSRIWKGEWVAVRKDPDSVDVLDSSGNKVETLVADVAPAFFLLDKESALACASFHSWLSGQVGRLAVPEEHQGMAPGITRLWNEFRPLLGSLVVGEPAGPISQPSCAE